MNIRELDEESRRTGVWPPRRIILRVEREEGADELDAEGGAAPVKVGEVDLSAPPSAPKTARAVPAPLPAPSLSPSVTPSRRRGLPGSRGVTPAPEVSAEDAAFDKWLAEPLPSADPEPEYQPPPEWLPGDVRVRAERRHRRVARKARTQLFGASAATTLAVGGCAAALGLIGLSQTESVGGSLGVPSIGVFGSAPEPASNERADSAAGKPAQSSSDRPRSRDRASGGSTRQSARRAPAASTPQRSSAPTGDSTPARPAANRSTPAPRASNPPPPPPPPPARTQQPRAPARSTAQAPPVVWDAPSTASAPATSAPSSSAGSVPSRPVQTAPSRPATSSTPTPSAPAP